MVVLLLYATSGRVISFATGLVSNATSGEAVAQANLTSTVSGSQEGEIYFAGGSAAYSAVPFVTGVAGVTANSIYKELGAAATYKVFSRTAATVTSGTAGGWYISADDKAAGRTGYFVVEVCYIQPNEAPGYEDIDGYLLGRTVS